MSNLENKPRSLEKTSSINRLTNRFIGWTIAQEPSPLSRYGLACLALVVAILFKLGLNRVVASSQGTPTPFLTIFAAIMVAAWFGGFGPGLLVTFGGALAADFLFIVPSNSLELNNTQDWINLGIFILEGILISGLCEILRRALRSRAREIEERYQTQVELTHERERYAVTLASIGDAVIATDVAGCITFLNSVAQTLTGWSQDEAVGLELSQVFKIINEQSRQTVENPVKKVLELGTVIGLANHTLLVTKEGGFIPIDDSGAPIKSSTGIGETIGVVLVFRDVTERKRQEEQQTFLVEASELLATTLDYERTLQNIVQLAVPFLADWCSIDLIGEDGKVQRMASAHINPAKQAIVQELHQRYPYHPNQPHPLRDLLLAGRSQVLPQIEQAELEVVARSPEHLQVLKEIGLKSGMTVPLIVRGVVIGAFTLSITESQRRYTEADLALVQELAARASLAIDNARLYQETQQALTQRSQAVNFYRQLEEKLTVLIEASDTLLSSLKLDSVIGAIVELSHRLIAADAYGVWRDVASSGEWRTLVSSGLSEEYQQLTARNFGAGPAITAPIIAEDVEEIPALAPRIEGYRKEGIRSLLVVPLRIQGIESGTIAFYYRQPHHFSQLEIRVATALANLAAVAIGNAEIYEEQSLLRGKAETAQQRLAFLADTSNELASSLDYEVTLQKVAELTVPKLADWCSVYISDQQGKPRRVALAHVDPAKVEWAINLQQELESRYPYDPNATRGLPNVLRNGQAELYPVISDEVLVAVAQDEDHLRLLRELGFSSSMSVPLKTRDRVVGALQLVATESGYHYNDQDLELVQEVARRAAMAVDNARLYAEAQQAIAIREEFLSVAAHELKTPVTAVRGFAQLLMRQLNQEKQPDPIRLRRSLDMINQQSERLLKLIVRLLDLSRLQGGRLVIEPEVTDLTPVIQRVVEGVRTTAEKHTLVVETASSIIANVDALRIEQVVINLLDNAVKYSPDGGVIELKLSIPTPHYIEMRVKDQGLGIAPEDRDRIFERFYQAHDQGFGGIGIGLYISRQIIELHGGKIEAEFPAEGGTIFIVTLPDGLLQDS